MNAYERERAECAADEEARADRRLQAWCRRHTDARPVRVGMRSDGERIGDTRTLMRKAG